MFRLASSGHSTTIIPFYCLYNSFLASCDANACFRTTEVRSCTYYLFDSVRPLKFSSWHPIPFPFLFLPVPIRGRLSFTHDDKLVLFLVIKDDLPCFNLSVGSSIHMTCCMIVLYMNLGRPHSAANALPEPERQPLVLRPRNVPDAVGG